MFSFLNNYSPQPILLEIGFIQIHWYGFLITLAAMIGFFVFYKLARKFNLDKNYIFDLTFWLIIWGLIGGRLYHVLSEIGYYSKNLLEIFYVWNGGMGIYGAIVAGVIVVFVKCSHPERSEGSVFRNKFQILRRPIRTPQNDIFYKLLNLLAPALALGQAIGRWGNYFNQELYGLPSNLPWAIPIDLANRLPNYLEFTHFHPVFLYESIFCFFLTVILSILILKKLKCKGSENKNPGSIFLLYILLYSLWRFFIEFLRIDPQPIFLNLRLAQWTSLVFIILSILFFFVLGKWYNRNNEQKQR